MDPIRRRQQRLLLAIFVLSGFAGLIYQSIWSHYLGLFMGHAAFAQALVLAIFMGGMALGAAWIARSGERWRNLVRGYAVVEVVIGVFGLLFHYVFVGVVGFSYDTLIPALGAPWAVNLAKWLIAAALILPQTILLGMTFPLMSGGLIRRFPGQDGAMLGGLYFTNSLGAAIGALATAFVLLPWVGLPGATAAAGLINLAVAALAWWLARDPEPAPRPVAVSAQGPGAPRPLLRLVLLGTALSGAASFVYEIVWIRMLSLAVGSTLHAFELMLASFILGIALGGLWVRHRADRTADPLRMVGWMQVWMGLTALASLVFYANAFGWVGWLMQALGRSDAGYALFNAGTAGIAMLIMLPSAFFAGTTLPLFTVALLRAGAGERAIGRVYAWNTMGAIVGVFAAIHLLIPGLGLKLALCVAAAVDMTIGLVLLRRGPASRPVLLRFATAGALAVIGLALAITRVPFDPMRLASGVYRSGHATLDPDERIVFYRDGKTASVSVVASPAGYVRIATNGKVDASISMIEGRPPQLDEPTMVLAAALPLAMHDNPRQVGVIGFGSGLTTHALLADPRIERVDTIEIEAAMVEGAKAFGEKVERAYLDPRSNIIIDDAKSVFAGQQLKYDIIVSEPSNPWISGVGALFSREFYEFVPRHLADDGLMVQWIQLYEINEELVASVLNALTPAFQDYAAYLSNHSDLLIIASPHGPLPQARFERVLSGQLGDDLARLGLTEASQLAFRKVADARLLRALGRLHGDRANSDFHPILSLEAPRTRYMNTSAQALFTLPFREQPVLEFLGVREPIPAAVPVPPFGHFPADERSIVARLMLPALRGMPYEVPAGTPAVSMTPALLLRTLLADCALANDPEQQAMIGRQLVQVAELTLPYLAATELRESWIAPDWVQCEALPPAIAELLALIGAHAGRDPDAMIALGDTWLAGIEARRPISLPEADALALSGVLLAHARRGDWAAVAAAEQRLGEQVPARGSAGQLRSLLLALADAGPDVPL